MQISQHAQTTYLLRNFAGNFAGKTSPAKIRQQNLASFCIWQIDMLPLWALTQTCMFIGMNLATIEQKWKLENFTTTSFCRKSGLTNMPGPCCRKLPYRDTEGLVSRKHPTPPWQYQRLHPWRCCGTLRVGLKEPPQIPRSSQTYESSIILVYILSLDKFVWEAHLR